MFTRLFGPINKTKTLKIRLGVRPEKLPYQLTRVVLAMLVVLSAGLMNVGAHASEVYRDLFKPAFYSSVTNGEAHTVGYRGHNRSFHKGRYNRRHSNRRYSQRSYSTPRYSNRSYSHKKYGNRYYNNRSKHRYNRYDHYSKSSRYRNKNRYRSYLY